MLTPFSSFRETYGQEQKRSDARSKEDYKEIIMENIGYEILLRKLPYDEEPLDEITELIADTVRSTKTTLRIPGDDKPAEAVTSRFLKLIGEHIRFVLACLRKNTTQVRNIRQYLLALLYNTPMTISNDNTALVSHDMASGKIASPAVRS